MPQSIFDYDIEKFKEIISSWGQPAYRTIQIWQGLYQKFYRSPGEFTNLPISLKSQLAATFGFVGFSNDVTFLQLEPTQHQISSDQSTKKTLFKLEDHKLIEAVLMRYDNRQTLCISSQAGCAMGCVFCATGQMGFDRNLTSGEIVEQVLYYARLLALENLTITNVVIMGMGEPFHNYEATMAAIDRLNHPQGMNLGARRFTISTVGLVPLIRRFTAEKRQINLAISLHAVENKQRSIMLPINKKYPVEELMSACKEYIETTHRRLSFEWALIDGENDSIDHARKLGKLLSGLRLKDGTTLVHVNVIPLNPTHRFQGKASKHSQATTFKAELEKYGVPCTIRVRRGIDIQAGCGQLAGNVI